MRQPCGAMFLSVAVSWSAAAPASHGDDAPGQIGPFEISSQLDFDTIVSLADAEAVDAGPHADLRVRTGAEAVSSSGVRWGGALSLAVRSRDGRRGLQPPRPAAAAQPGLVTGLGGQGVAADWGAGLIRAEVYAKASLFEVFAGQSVTAARRERLTPSTALRLSAADGALIDPIGAGLVNTAASLTSPAPTLTVRTRRLAGFAAAASYTPRGDACGIEICRDAAYGRVDSVLSASIGFDRRRPATGARWQIQAGAERGEAEAGPLSGALEDPWLVTVQAAREAEGLTLSINGLHAREGPENQEYSALSAAAAQEAGDWLLEASAGWAYSDIAARSGWTAQIGASRFVGRRGLAGMALQVQHDGGAALLAEAGLRF